MLRGQAGDLARIGRAASALFKFKWAYGPGRTIGIDTVNVEFPAIIVPLEDYWKCYCE